MTIQLIKIFGLVSLPVAFSFLPSFLASFLSNAQIITSMHFLRSKESGEFSGDGVTIPGVSSS